MIYFIVTMPPEKPADIDINRRDFIKLSLVAVGALMLGKVSGLLSLPSQIATASFGTKEYKNVRYGFSLMHPSDLAVSTFSEGGATTITFQNPEKAEGFQMFITPHSEPHAGEVPYNGINGAQESDPRLESPGRESLTSIAVDGAIGDAFYSTNSALGATREIRIIHDGFLYELTTHKSLDTQLGAIIKTWKFV